MAEEVVLKAEPREGRGKGAAKKLRAGGMLPGVVYGGEVEPRSVAIDRLELIRALHAHGAHPVVTLKLDGKDQMALVKEVQVDPVHVEALHVDFLRIRADRPVHTEVAVHLVGDAAGVKLGGVLETHTQFVSIEALPRDIPGFLELDVSDLGMGDAVRVGDLTPPTGVTILTGPDELGATVAAPRVEVAAPVEEEEAAEEAAAEEGEAPEAPEGEAEGE